MFDENIMEVVEMNPLDLVGTYVWIEVNGRYERGRLQRYRGRVFMKTDDMRIDFKDGDKVLLDFHTGKWAKFKYPR